jgi:hypothetical protein
MSAFAIPRQADGACHLTISIPRRSHCGAERDRFLSVIGLGS